MGWLRLVHGLEWQNHVEIPVSNISIGTVSFDIFWMLKIKKIVSQAEIVSFLLYSTKSTFSTCTALLFFVIKVHLKLFKLFNCTIKTFWKTSEIRSLRVLPSLFESVGRSSSQTGFISTKRYLRIRCEPRTTQASTGLYL